MTDLFIIQVGAESAAFRRAVFGSAEARFVQTTEHPFIKKLVLDGKYTSMDDLYES